MKGQEVKRSAMLKRLLQEQRKKLPDGLEPDEREAQAQALMTKLLGERWKQEVGPEIEIVEIVVEPEDDQEGVEFYEKVGKLAQEDGVGVGPLEFDKGRTHSCHNDKDKIKAEIMSLIDRLLEGKSES